MNKCIKGRQETLQSSNLGPRGVIKAFGETLRTRLWSFTRLTRLGSCKRPKYVPIVKIASNKNQKVVRSQSIRRCVQAIN
jgi:hypothetical protein